MDGLSVVRRLLRAIDRNVTRVAGNRQWRDYVVAQIRLEAKDPQSLKERLGLASDLAFLINNVASHKALLQKYNIGIDPERRNKDMVQAVAKRVGFKLPDEQR